MYVERLILDSFFKLLQNFPSVLITGPRQSGKTTFLLQKLKDKSKYISFDDPFERKFANDDPAGFIEKFTGHSTVILDEIQYVPKLFSYIKMDIDQNKHNKGKWVLTGSQQFQVMKNVSDSLAGRIAIMELLPFNFIEKKRHFKLDLIEHIWFGGYPEVVLNPKIREIWHQNYLATYLERDLRQLQNIHNLDMFQTFLALIAANHGQELNLSRISRQCGASVPTCKDWLSVLKAGYLITNVKPFFHNFGKRIIKAPKIYFIDSSLAAEITRQPSPEAMLNGAMAGQFFEGFIVTETFKILSCSGIRPELYYWRSHDGLEVDLIIRKNGSLIPIEIKKTATPTTHHSSPLIRFRDIAAKHEHIGQPLIVCTTSKSKEMSNNVLCLNWQDYMNWLIE